MFVWSKRLVSGLLLAFGLILLLFLVSGISREASLLNMHTTRWIALNYVGLLVWVFVWMIDQARVRGKNVWLWLLPFMLAPLPTLMAYILFLQKRLGP